MKILISGSTGFLGSELVAHLNQGSHEVIRLVRHPSKTPERQIQWDPEKEMEDPKRLEGIEAVIHLSGENIAALRWTEEKKRKIRESRVQSTGVLARALAKLSHPPRLFLAASAIGFYGDRGEGWLTEESPPGNGFLAEVCREWEGAAEPLHQKNIRVAHMRFGMILGKGGALSKLLPVFRLGLGGTLGDGGQYMSWITLEDVLKGVDHLIRHDDLKGPVNFVSPEPVTNREFTKTLGAVLKRPTIFGTPAVALRLLAGEMADEMLLASVRVKPQRLQESGFSFESPELKGALEKII